jgi:hypothetical protein
MVPGQNLLNMALRMIASQGLVYYHYLGRTQNPVGQDVSQYSDGVKITGSFQPVQRVLYQALGLDLQKDYWNFYASNNLQDVNRSVSGDQIAFNGQRYQCESDSDWYPIDGWKGTIFIHIGLDNADNNILGFNTKPPENTNLNFGNGNFLGGNL